MSQSSLLVALLAATFLLYVAAKGRLPVYTGVLWGAKPDANSGGDGGGKTTKTAKTALKVAKVAAEVAPYVI